MGRGDSSSLFLHADGAERVVGMGVGCVAVIMVVGMIVVVMLMPWVLENTG